ncbi:MAG TPA: acetyl-CoA acetyltransferase [Stellaceae bacterium]|nr:acetyl-CoA acetyltransferase [Stellaceae bacterium]
MTDLDARFVPVIVGVGEIKDRPDDPARGLEPVALMAVALRRAEADAGAALLRRLDTLDVVNSVSWPYDDLAGLLGRGIGAGHALCRHGEIGGHTPVRFIQEAAQRIARGDSRIAAICGGEASHTATWAKRNHVALDWTKPAATPGAVEAESWLPARNRDYLSPIARRHGISEPVTVYPLYENACQAAWGQTPAQAAAESADLWSRLAAVAAGNPNAWVRRAVTAEEVSAVTAQNRPIAWPYPKLMVANPAVNQGAAILLTSLAVARDAGIPDARLVHVHGGAAAAEPKDWMQRDSFVHAAGQEVVLDAVLRQVGGDVARFSFLELYSCFPVVPKMARRGLGLPERFEPSVAGGLTFHGAPLNNYMTHGAAAMVRALRKAPQALGLLYGQGGFLTAHYGLVLGSYPAEREEVRRPFDLQAEADRRRGPAPPIVEDAAGEASVETYTIVFRRDGEVAFGTVVLRLPNGCRTLARVPAEDRVTLDRLMTPERSAIGLIGAISPGEDGLLAWSASP